MDEIECLPISYRFVARGVTVQVTARNTGTVIIIARVARGVTDQEEERKYHELTTYGSTSLQRPPWGQKKPGGGEVLPYKRLIGMCRWMGSYFHDWSDYNGVAFSKDLLEWGLKFSDFWGK